MDEVLAYCVKEKAKRVMKDPEQSTDKRGKPITKGTCEKCGTKMVPIGRRPIPA